MTDPVRPEKTVGDVQAEPVGGSVPPPLPPSELMGPAASWRQKFEDDFGPCDSSLSAMKVVDVLLKRPACLVHDLIERNTALTIGFMLTVISVLCLLAYGFVMGTFTGGEQLLAAPLKMVIGMFFSALICLPSLYIFICLSGGNQSVAQVSGLLLMSISLGAVLLLGFAPIAWLFSQATRSVSFMGCLHLAFWMIGTYLGLRLLATAFAHLNGTRMRIFRLWACIFVAVVMQMSTTLRPLIGQPGTKWLEGKRFFLAHWANNVLNGR